MPYDPRKHHRRSIRLQGYDYTQPGAYFITICVHNRENLLGEIVGEEMRLNDLGDIAKMIWNELLNRYANITLDEFVIMPNHIHGIVEIQAVGAVHEPPLHEPPLSESAGSEPRDFNDPLTRRQMTIPKIVGYFKMNSAKRANQIRSTEGAPFWQRNYYEHIIRNDRELHAIRAYIRRNPLQWALDRDNLYNAHRLPPPTTIQHYLADL